MFLSIAMRLNQMRAFTLIELMVTIALIGILTAMILPEMSGTYEDAVLRASARKLVSACNLASSRAIALSQLHLLWLDPKSGRFIVEAPRPSSGKSEVTVAPREIPGGQGEIDRRITIMVRRPGEELSHVAADSNNGEEGTAVPEALAGEDGSSASAERAPEAMGDGVALKFQPDGTADPAEIVLRDGQGFRLALRINPITARVRIVELAKE
jgi:type II secretion system protein H